VNKDNLLFATIGLLVGFIAGYLLHEVMVARQPLRRVPGEVAAVTPGPAPGEDGAGGDPAPGAPAVPPPNGPNAPGDQGGARIDPGAGEAGGPAVGAAGAAAGGAPPMAAVQQLRDYVASHPKDADAVLKLANLNFDIQSWARARDLYTQYLSLHQADADVLTDLGNSYRGLQQFDAALAQYHRAEQLAPGHWKSLFSEVVVLGFDLKQLDAADKAMTRLQAIAPQQPEVVQLAAALQRRRGAA
jgi:hypothetical protein